MSILEDIRTLNKTGIWPDGKIPSWAAEAAEQYNVRASSIHVQLYGMGEVLKFQHEQLNRLATQLSDLFDRVPDELQPAVLSLIETCRKAVEGK